MPQSVDAGQAEGQEVLASLSPVGWGEAGDMDLAVVLELLCFLVDVSEDRKEGGRRSPASLIELSLQPVSPACLGHSVLR